MKISREVIEDLIAVYLSGEASSDTKKIIEEFLIVNPDMKYLIEKENIYFPETEMLKPEVEMQTLKKTKFYTFIQSLFIGLGVFFTLSIFVFSFSSENGIKWLMLGNTEVTMIYASFASMSWFLVFLIIWRKGVIRRT